MKCRVCKSDINAKDEYCRVCGTIIKEKTNTVNKSLATSSIILGILSITVGVIFVPLGIIGLVLGICEKEKCPERTLGIVLNTIGVVITIIVWSFFLVLSVGPSKYIREFKEELKYNDVVIDDDSFLEYRLPNGKTILDVMKEENVKLAFQALSYAANSVDVIKLLVENGYTVIVGYIGEDVLFKKIDDTRTVLDFLMENKCIGRNVLKNITTKHKDIVPTIAEYDEKLLGDFDEFILFETEYKGKRLIEYDKLGRIVSETDGEKDHRHGRISG